MSRHTEEKTVTIPHAKPGATRPRLPHEHDQSSDSQGAPVQDVIKQAQEDIQSGQKDTDLHGTPGQDKPTK